MRKIICFILCIVTSMAVLTGCTLFEHDYNRDYQQVVAEINPITETKEVPKDKDSTSENPEMETIEFTSEKKYIYKSELVNAFSSNGQQMVTEQGMTIEQALESLLRQLITRELILIEADRALKFREIEMDLTATNRVKKLVYNSIDAQILSICNTILKERNETLRPVPNTDEDGSQTTTYPTPEKEEPEDDVKDTEEWKPSLTRYPGMTGDADSISLEKEAVRRLVTQLKETVKNDFRVTKEQKELFKKDAETLENLIKEKKEVEIYPILGESEMIKWLITRSAENQVKVELLQENIVDSVYVTDEQINENYNTILTNQKASFKDIAKYKAAVEDGKENLFYHPSSDYFYVKHILLPFTEEQKAKLTAFSASGKTKEDIDIYRKQLSTEIKVYEHVNGEDDLAHPKTVSQVMNEIQGKMKQVETRPYDAERTFNSLIYKYNTDPGIFNNAKGYAVGPTPDKDKGETEKYMLEFAVGARELKEKSNIGAISDLILTDFGFHILYYANNIKTGIPTKLSEFETPGEYKTYYKILKDQLVTQQENERFTDWQNEKISYYENLVNGPIVKYVNRYKNLLK